MTTRAGGNVYICKAGPDIEGFYYFIEKNRNVVREFSTDGGPLVPRRRTIRLRALGCSFFALRDDVEVPAEEVYQLHHEERTNG